MSKITIVGAGDVGSAATNMCAVLGLGDIVLLDIVKGLPQGRAMDIEQGMAVIGSDATVTGTNSYDDTAGSDVVVITAGLPRKPGMTREDLLGKNLPIVQGVMKQAVAKSPNAVFVIVTNPLDATVDAAYRISGLSRGKVIGMGGALDCTRMRNFIAKKTGVSRNGVEAAVIGSHGEAMLPLVAHSSVGGVKVSDMLTESEQEEVYTETKTAAAEVIKRLGTRSTMFAPGAAISFLVRAIVEDKKQVISAHTLLDGEYGVTDQFVGVPCIIGKEGVEKVVELKLLDSEQKLFDQAVSHLKALKVKGDQVLEEQKKEKPSV